MINKKTQLIITGIGGFTAVALGAFGAHALKSLLTDSSLEVYKTDILYHLIHSVALLAIALSSNYKLNAAFILFLIGIILFSFSLYVYSITGIKILQLLRRSEAFLFCWVGWQ
jgi:uncharacterized membrane protein YgdD (TMEM256/DUF423 family)